jgi:hypothetical protein
VTVTREIIPITALREKLLSETETALGRDVGFLSGQIKIWRVAAQPNWQADCGVAGLSVLTAFNRARATVQKRYNVA